MKMTVYELQDRAMPQPLDCRRCGRRTYLAAVEWAQFTHMVISQLRTRCAGCGEWATACVCACSREGCGPMECEHMRRAA